MKHIENFKVSQLKSVEEKENLLKSVELNIDFENHLKPDFQAAETLKKTGKTAQQYINFLMIDNKDLKYYKKYLDFQRCYIENLALGINKKIKNRMKSINEADSIIKKKQVNIDNLKKDLEKAERENWLKKKEFEMIFQKKDTKNSSIYMDYKKLGNDKNTT